MDIVRQHDSVCRERTVFFFPIHPCQNPRGNDIMARTFGYGAGTPASQRTENINVAGAQAQVSANEVVVQGAHIPFAAVEEIHTATQEEAFTVGTLNGTLTARNLRVQGQTVTAADIDRIYQAMRRLGGR